VKPQGVENVRAKFLCQLTAKMHAQMHVRRGQQPENVQIKIPSSTKCVQRAVAGKENVDAEIGATNVRNGPEMENAEENTSLKNVAFLVMTLFASARIPAQKHVKIGPAGICAKFPGSMLIAQNPANGKIVLTQLHQQYHLHHQQHQRIAHANVNLSVTIRLKKEVAQTQMFIGNAHVSAIQIVNLTLSPLPNQTTAPVMSSALTAWDSLPSPGNPLNGATALTG